MIGTILQLPAGNRAGVIRSENGSRIAFAVAGVIGDCDTLAVGHRVSFEVQNSARDKSAIGVLRELPTSVARRSKRDDTEPDLRYMGFDQSKLERRYRFRAVGTGQDPELFVVTVELAMLLASHVSVQELPQLCMRKLAADLKTAGGPSRHVLEQSDLNAFIAACTAKAERKRPRHGPPQRRTAPAWGDPGMFHR